MSDIVEEVRRRGGIVRTDQLRAQGISRHVIERAVRGRELIRPRRGWVAWPRADPMLIAAARAGVVVTCATQAARLDLWAPRERHHHVAVAPGSRAPVLEDPRSIVHWSKPLIARPPGALEDPVENVLALVARCLPREQALAVWESAARKRAVDLEVMRRMPLHPSARDLASTATPFSDSGYESIVVHRLTWLRERVVQQVVIAGRPVDILIGDRLVIQIDGGHHVGAQRDADNEHDARLRLMGYHVIRVGIAQIEREWPAVQARILRAIAQGLHTARRA